MASNGVGFITWSIELLSDTQAAALRRHVEVHSLAALKRDARLREDCAIEFACQIALRDGNAYTLPEAIELLTSGRTAPVQRLYIDALQLLRLRAAYARFVHLAACLENHAGESAN